MQSEALSPKTQKLISFIEFDDDEKLVYEIRKHPVGAFMLYAVGFGFAVVVLVTTVIFGAFLSSSSIDLGFDVSVFAPAIVIIGFVLALFSVVVASISAYLYNSNVLIVTSDKVAQFLRPSLFNHKVSQLSLGDIQDVTVAKQGVLANMFDYGKLVIETPGEQNNYEFTFAPKPYECAKAIVGAHEANLKTYGN